MEWVADAWVNADAVTTTVTTTTVNPYTDNSIESVTFAWMLNSFLLLAAIVAFEVLMCWGPGRHFLAPRLSENEEGSDLASSSSRDSLPFPFGWVRNAWVRREELTRTDIDGLSVVRFAVLGFKFSLVGSVLACVLVPIYHSGHGDGEGFNVYGVAHLSSDGTRWWAVVVGSYLMTGAFAHLSLQEWKSFIKTREQHFIVAAEGGDEIIRPGTAQARRTLIVENVPEDGRTVEAVSSFMDTLFGKNSVYCCHVQANTAMAYNFKMVGGVTRRCGCCTRCCVQTLQTTHQVRNTAIAAPQGLTGGARALLQDASTSLGGNAEDPVQRATLGAAAGAVRGIGGIGTDVLDRGFQAARLVQDATLGGGLASTAFVTLRRCRDSVAAQQLVLTKTPGWEEVRMHLAPTARDIVWKNAATPNSQTQVRQVVANIVTVVGLLFWAAPVSAVQLWSQVSKLHEQFPEFIDGIYNLSPFIYIIATGYLPVLALMALLKLLPIMFEWLATTYERRKSRPDIALITLQRNLNYQLATLYVTVFSGSLLTTLATINDEGLTEALKIFRQQIPQASVYFITFVLARAGTSIPLLLLRPAGLLGGADPKDKSKWAEVQCYYASEAADLGLIMTLALTYCIVSPIMCPAAMVYFGCAALVYRYLFLYVYTPDVDMDGAIWYKLFSGATIGLLLGNIVIMSLVGLNKGPTSPEFIIMFFLPFFTLGFLQYASAILMKPSLFMSISDARAADEKVDAAEAELATAAAYHALAGAQRGTGAELAAESAAFAATRLAEASQAIAFAGFDRGSYLDPILSDPMWDDFDEGTRANMIGQSLQDLARGRTNSA